MAVCDKAICYLFALLRCYWGGSQLFLPFPLISPHLPVFPFPPSVSMVAPCWSQRRKQTADRNIPWISLHLDRAIGTLHWRLSNAWLAVFVSCLRPKNLDPLQHLNVVVVRTARCHSTTGPILNMFIWVPYTSILVCYSCFCFLTPPYCELDIGNIESFKKPDKLDYINSILNFFCVSLTSFNHCLNLFFS